jgi:hypothetical protein
MRGLLRRLADVGEGFLGPLQQESFAKEASGMGNLCNPLMCYLSTVTQL